MEELSPSPQNEESSLPPKKSRTKKIVLWVLGSVLVIVCVLWFFPPFLPARIVKSEKVCYLFDHDCRNQLKNTKKVEILSPNTIRINTTINAQSDMEMEIVSAKKEKNKIILNLIETGLEPCLCGANFIKLEQ